MLSGSRIDFAAIGQWLAGEDTNNRKKSYQGEEMRLPEEQTHRLFRPRLIVFKRPEIVPTPLQHPLVQLPLAVQGVPGDRLSPQLQLAQQVLGHPRFTLLAIPPYPPFVPAPGRSHRRMPPPVSPPATPRHISPAAPCWRPPPHLSKPPTAGLTGGCITAVAARWPCRSRAAQGWGADLDEAKELLNCPRRCDGRGRGAGQLLWGLDGGSTARGRCGGQRAGGRPRVPKIAGTDGGPGARRPQVPDAGTDEPRTCQAGAGGTATGGAGGETAPHCLMRSA